MSVDREQIVSALVLAATALFLISIAPGMRYRRAARIVAVAVYAVIFAGVVVAAALWALGVEF